MGDLFKIRDPLGELTRPFARGRGGILIEQLVGCLLDGDPGAGNHGKQCQDDDPNGLLMRHRPRAP